jgi:hypothetical protein
MDQDTKGWPQRAHQELPCKRPALRGRTGAITFEPLCWFLHDSNTARVARPLLGAAALVLVCYLIAMAVVA